MPEPAGEGFEPGIEQGIALFNAGKFFEAHEAWERLWLRAAEPDKCFLQGLIQAAAALLHLQRGNRLGADALLAKAQQKLGAIPGEYRGLALDQFRAELKAFVAPAAVPETPRPEVPTLRRRAPEIR